MARPKINFCKPSYEDRFQEIRARWLADEADRNAVAEETNCALIADEKEGQIVNVKIEPGLPAAIMDTMVSVQVPVDKKLTLNTKLGTPALLTYAKDKGSVINIDDITPNDVRHNIPSTPKKTN